MIFPARVLRTHTFGLLLLGLQPLCSEVVLAAGERHYSIGAGPLDQVLSRFGAEAGISMAGSALLTAGKTSQGLQGDFNTEAGLNQLLAGTGLGYVRQADGGYALRLRLDAVSLPTQKVKGENPDEEEVYRAPRSSVYILSLIHI